MSARVDLNRFKKKFGIASDKELAALLSTSKNNIDSWIKRDRIPEKWVIIMDDFEHQKSRLDNVIGVPLLKLQAGAGEGIYNFTPSTAILSLSPTLFPFVADEKATAVEIMGDSMEPTLRNGDYIIVTPPEASRSTEDGIYALRIDGMLKVKSLHFKLDGSIDIISDNSKYGTENHNPQTSQLDFQILGRKRLHISR